MQKTVERQHACTHTLHCWAEFGASGLRGSQDREKEWFLGQERITQRSGVSGYGPRRTGRGLSRTRMGDGEEGT